MKNFLTAIALCAICFQVTFSQPLQKCATTDVEKKMEQSYPGYRDAVRNAFFKAKTNAEVNAARSNVIDTIYRIRTVVHVVYTRPEENLDDSIILSQIEVLNEDYRRRNPDAANTRAIFQDFAADAGIEFFLADEDPNGNPTNGITHTQGNPAPSIFGGFGANDDVKQSSKGGVNPWPTDRYFNIWVCNLLGGLGVLGYAYPPAAPLPNWGTQNPNADSAKQGVVLYYKAVGRNNPYAIDNTTDGGRSATHEVGHYLGLRHIWGDDNSLFGPGNKCAGDVGGGEDGIDDTPDAKDASQQNCDSTKNTCPDPNLDQDYPDMIENFMDYSSDDCLNMFTNGQVALMREVIKLYRSKVAEKIPNNTSAIQDFPFHQLIKITPNPAKDFIVVESKINEIEPAQIQLLSLDGRVLQTTHAVFPTTKISISELRGGFYLLAFSSSTYSAIKTIMVTE